MSLSIKSCKGNAADSHQPTFYFIGCMRIAQLFQQRIIEIHGVRSLHRQMKIGFIAAQSMIQCELADTQDFQLQIFNAFLPSLTGFVIKQTNA